MKRQILAVAVILVSSVLLSAQVERITISMVPAPNQTLHARTSMVMTMNAESDPSAERSLPIPTVVTTMTTAAEHTTTVGPTDAQGHYQARVVCDTASFTATMNGQPMPANGQKVPGAPPAELVGAIVTFSYDDQGKVIDIAIDAGMPPSLAGPLKQMLTGALGAAPPMTLSVGESITVPSRLDLPMPTAPNTPAMTMTGETRYTLTSVSFDGADRIAHLKSAMTGVMKQNASGEGGGPKFTFEIKSTSEGISDVNIDRGIVLHSEQRMIVEGAMRFDSSNAAMPAMPAMLMHGAGKVSADLTK